MAIAKKSSVNVIISDLHTNSTVGLCPIQVNTDDGGAYRASLAQQWIWARFEDFSKKAEKCIKKGRRRNTYHLTILGETVDGVHHKTTQICTSNEVQQCRNAVKALRPLVDDLQPDYIHVCKGTPAHSGRYGMLDEIVAKDIGAVPLYPQKPEEERVYARFFWLYECDGVLFEAAHYMRSGRLEWTEPNALNKLAFRRKWHYLRRNERAPDVVARGDTHKWGVSAKSKDTEDILAIITPSWQLSTEFGHSIDPGSLLPIGGFIFECQSGRYDYESVTYDPPGEKIWRPPKK